MSRRLVSLTLDTLEDLPRRCRRCVFWELDPVAARSAERACATDLEKEAWVSATLLEWGCCGKLVYVDGAPAGYALFAPSSAVPRSVAFPTGPASPDAALLMTAHVLDEYAGGGLGRMLVQGVARDLTRRGIKAIEAFGDEQWSRAECVAPADYFRSVGFKTVRPHPRYPRLRMELRTALSWKSEVEAALDRLLGSMAPDPVLRPATGTPFAPAGARHHAGTRRPPVGRVSDGQPAAATAARSELTSNVPVG